MNVLVTGGTGFVGRHILRELQRAGHGIHLLVRDARPRQTAELAAKFEAKLHVGDVRDFSLLSGACAGVDAVIHLVGIISEVGEQTFENVHIGGTRIAFAAAHRAGVEHEIAVIGKFGLRNGRHGKRRNDCQPHESDVHGMQE